MKEKWNFYRPAVAAFLTMMAMSLTASTLSFFLEPVCEDLQVGRGSFSAIFSLMTLSGALTNPILGQFAGKRGVKPILLASGVWMFGSMVLLSLARDLRLLYLAAFLMGAFGTNCVALCANVAVQHAYDGPRASSLLGVVMAGSGFGGMIFNLLIPALMGPCSWRLAMQAMGLSWLGLCLLAAVVLGKEKRPCGAHREVRMEGMTRAEALKSPKFYLLVLIIIIVTAACGIQQQQPAILGGYGFPGGRISLLLSAQTAVLAVGKILQGLVYGRFGIRRGGCAMLGLFALGCCAIGSAGLVYPGLLLLAFGFGVYTTWMPMVTRHLFGEREYAAIWGIVATAGSVGTFVANPLWGGVYDLTGSYRIGMTVAAVLLAAAILSLRWLLGESKN